MMNLRTFGASAAFARHDIVGGDQRNAIFVQPCDLAVGNICAPTAALKAVRLILERAIRAPDFAKRGNASGSRTTISMLWSTMPIKVGDVG